MSFDNMTKYKKSIFSVCYKYDHPNKIPKGDEIEILQKYALLKSSIMYSVLETLQCLLRYAVNFSIHICNNQ